MLLNEETPLKNGGGELLICTTLGKVDNVPRSEMG